MLFIFNNEISSDMRQDENLYSVDSVQIYSVGVKYTRESFMFCNTQTYADKKSLPDY